MSDARAAIFDALLATLNALREDGRLRHETAIAQGYPMHECEYWSGYLKALDEVEQQILPGATSGCE